MDKEWEACRWSWLLLPLALFWLGLAACALIGLWPEAGLARWRWYPLVAFGPSLYVLSKAMLTHRAKRARIRS
ncbi:MAG: hypothetical protein ACREUF_02930 [Solimonas sp.]